MSDLLDELEDIHVFSEGGDSPKHGESEEYQVIMRPRESFLMVRKPTKRRLFSPKTENDASKSRFIPSCFILLLQKQS